MNIVKGNLIDLAEAGHFNIIVHGCNCFHTMGGGIAREIKARYPDAYAADKGETVFGDYDKLGSYTVMLGKQFNIVNAYTQYATSRGEDVFNYAAFELILDKLANQYPCCRFGLPWIGCGLAGGDKNRIMKIIDDFSVRIAKTGGTVTIAEL